MNMEDLKIEDLLPECENCEGSGKLENPLMKQQNRGFGTRIISATPVDCNKCNGSGVIPTQSGKTLLEFFRKSKQKYLLY